MILGEGVTIEGDNKADVKGAEAAADLGYRAMDCTDTFLKFQTSL